MSCDMVTSEYAESCLPGYLRMLYIDDMGRYPPIVAVGIKSIQCQSARRPSNVRKSYVPWHDRHEIRHVT